MSTWSVKDANLNRLTEGLRVIEDYFRFSSKNSDLSQKICSLRHEAVNALKKSMCTRTVSSDPGKCRTGVFSGLTFMLRANIHRVCEAARVLEEYGKLEKDQSSVFFQELRFFMYELESVLSRDLSSDFLYVIITPEYCLKSPEETAEILCKSGVDIIQYREKHGSDHLFLKRAHKIREITSLSSVKLIINNRPDIAMICGADGVHLGQDDLPAAEVRKICGTSMIVGKSTHNFQQLCDPENQECDYLAYGPLISCNSKEKTEIPTGFSGLEKLEEISRKKPVFVIGGLNSENCALAVSKNALRLVFMTSVCKSSDPEAEIIKIRKITGVKK